MNKRFLTSSYTTAGVILAATLFSPLSGALKGAPPALPSPSSHFTSLKRTCLAKIREGMRSRNLEDNLLALFGAGLSLDENLTDVIETALHKPHPQMQLCAIQFLSQLHDSRSSQLLNRAMNSRFLSSRLEAAHTLAQRGYPTIRGQIESLLQKAPPESLTPLIHSLAQVGNEEADALLKKCLMTQSGEIQRAAILAIAHHKRDDLLPEIRLLSSHLEAQQQEACAFALGCFQDQSALPRLRELSLSPVENVRIASLYSLWKMGCKEQRHPLESLAKQENLFSIYALGSIPESRECLVSLLSSPSLPTQAHAALALLELKDPRSLPTLQRLFFSPHHDLVALPTRSPSRALQGWKVLSSHSPTFQSQPSYKALAHQVKASILTQISQLPQAHSLPFFTHLFQSHQNDAIPIAVQLLEANPCPEALSLLKTGTQQPGSPLTRTSCHLALMRLHQGREHRRAIENWILNHKEHPLIQLHASSFGENSGERIASPLTPTEHSSLLLQSVETLASLRDASSIQVLSSLLKESAVPNQYVLAGLILRATQ